MPIDLISAFQTIEQWGFYEILLPFLLVFVLCFAILQRIQLFGPNSKPFNVIISLVIGMLMVRGGQQAQLVEFINNYLPNVSAVVVVFLGFLIILGLFGVGAGAFKGGLMVAFVIVSLVGGIWALTQATQQGNVEFSIPLIGDISLTESDAGALVVIGVFLLIVFIAIGYKPKKKGIEGFLDQMGRVGDTFAGGRPPQ